GRRSDELCPNQSWCYTSDIDNSMIRVWPSHEHAQHVAPAINRGLFGGIVVLPKQHKPPPGVDLPEIFKDARRRVLKAQKKKAPRRSKWNPRGFSVDRLFFRIAGIAGEDGRWMGRRYWRLASG
ncbi:MAG: hypothetical protein ABFS23_13285, partial [Pseudomonadota bacterium]